MPPGELKTPELAHGDAQGIEMRVDRFGLDAQSGRLLQRLRVVDGADGGVLPSCGCGDHVPSGLPLDESEQSRGVENDH